MNYAKFTVADFVADPFFQQWILSKDEMADAFWKKWLQDYPEKRSDIQEAAMLIQSIQFKIDHPDAQDFQQVWQDIIANRTERVYKIKQSSGRAYRWYAAAAVIVLGLTAAFFTLRNTQYNPLLQSYSTDFGQTEEITLPDGSSVVLGANSYLHFHDNWTDQKPRLVMLEGEAYFSVVRQENHQKFVVQSKDVSIEVLGTKFNVNNRRDENRILLEEGSIRLTIPPLTTQSSEASIEMKPGEAVAIADQQITKKVVDPHSYTSWTKGVLIFEKAPLREVIQVIEDHYGYTVVAKNINPNELILTAELRTVEIDMILHYLSEVFQLTVEKDHDTITLAKP
jgi:ferric-dicitrate binding protein FerR (iron transport regulator)